MIENDFMPSLNIRAQYAINEIVIKIANQKTTHEGELASLKSVYFWDSFESLKKNIQYKFERYACPLRSWVVGISKCSDSSVITYFSLLQLPLV
jgi:hypothetical protein